MYETDAYVSYFKLLTPFAVANCWVDSRKNGTEWIIKPEKEDDRTFYIVNLEGEIIGKVVPPLGYANNPIFSKDENSIIFRGSPFSSKVNPNFIDELYEYDLGELQTKRLTDYPSGDTTATIFDYHAGPPRLMSNGEGFVHIKTKRKIGAIRIQ